MMMHAASSNAGSRTHLLPGHDSGFQGGGGGGDSTLDQSNRSFDSDISAGLHVAVTSRSSGLHAGEEDSKKHDRVVGSRSGAT